MSKKVTVLSASEITVKARCQQHIILPSGFPFTTDSSTAVMCKQMLHRKLTILEPTERWTFTESIYCKSMFVGGFADATCLAETGNHTTRYR